MVSAGFLHSAIFCPQPTTESYQLEIVKANGLNPLRRLLQLSDLDPTSLAVSCVFSLTLQPTNHSPIIEAGFLRPLVALLAFKGKGSARLHAIGALQRLAASTCENRRAVVNAGAVQSIKELVLEAPVSIQIEMTGCIRNLSRSGMHPPLTVFSSLILPR